MVPMSRIGISEGVKLEFQDTVAVWPKFIRLHSDSQVPSEGDVDTHNPSSRKSSYVPCSFLLCNIPVKNGRR